MGDIHDDHHYYKAPRHNYNTDTSMTPFKRIPFQPQIRGFKSWYAVPPKRPEKKCLCRSTKVTVIPELSNRNQNQDLDVKIPVASTNSDCDSIDRHPISGRVVYDVPRPGVNEITMKSSDEFEYNHGNDHVGNFIQAPQVAWNLEKKTLTSACNRPRAEGLGHHDNREESHDNRVESHDNDNIINNNNTEVKNFFIERPKICDKKPFSDRSVTIVKNDKNTTSDDNTITLNNNSNNNDNNNGDNKNNIKSQHRQQAFLQSQTYLENFRQLLRQQNNINNNKESADNRLTSLGKSSTFSSSKDLERGFCRSKVDIATPKPKPEWVMEEGMTIDLN